MGLKYRKGCSSQEARHTEGWGPGEEESAPSRMVGTLEVQTSWLMQCDRYMLRERWLSVGLQRRE